MCMLFYIMCLLHLAVWICITGGQLQTIQSPVCPNKDVEIVCDLPNENVVLIWMISFAGTSSVIQTTFRSSDLGTSRTFQNDVYGFMASLDSIMPTYTSTLRVTVVTQLNRTNVTCTGTVESFSTIITVTGPPPMPERGITMSDQQYDTNSIALTLSWLPTAGVDNYTVSVLPELVSGQSTFTVILPSLSLSVCYRSEYSVNITANNCAGRSDALSYLFSTGGCQMPIQPGNGSISRYSSREDGATLTFTCNTGYIPQSSQISVCQNGDWTPNPDSHDCQDCGNPSPANGVSINPYIATTIGSAITFQCEDGLIPVEEVSASCGIDGEWHPDPSLHVCGNDSTVDCGRPRAPINGFINNYSSTLESSQITYQCNGFNSTVTKAVCFGNGSWTPNPANLDCPSSGVSSSPPIPVIVSVVLVIVLVISAAAVTIIVTIKVKKKKGCKDAGNSQLDLELHVTNEASAEYCTTKHPGPRGNQPVTVNSDTLVYAGLDLPSTTKSTSHADHADNPTSYADINFTAMSKPQKGPYRESADDLLNLDSLLIQLKPAVTSKWEQFAQVVGLGQEVIKDLSSCGPDERMVEMLDYWLRHHPSKPTWRNVAQVLEEIHLYQLADDLLKVYKTGELPVPFDMNEVPEGTLPRSEPPPPLPPKIADFDDDGTDAPQPHVSDLPPKPPPHRDTKGLCVRPPPHLPPPYHGNGESVLPPIRPPKPHSDRMPPRPPKTGLFATVPSLPPKPRT